MKTFKKLNKKFISIVAVLSIFSNLFLAMPTTLALVPTDNGSSGATQAPSGPQPAAVCQKTDTDVKLKACVTQSPIVKDIQEIINFLSAGVGVVVIGVIILGGIQYSLAGDNAQAITAAKQRIINGLIALIAFIFAFAFLNWLLPGGIIG